MLALAVLAVFSLAGVAAAATPAPPPGITATASPVDCQGNWQLIFNSTSDQDQNVNWFVPGAPGGYFYAGVKVLPAHGSVTFGTTVGTFGDLPTVPFGQSLTVTPQVVIPDGSGLGTVTDASLPSVTVSRPSSCAALCAPVLLTVNGSGQLTGSPEMNAITDRVKALALGAGQKLLVVPVAYPAVPWWQYVTAKLNFSLRPPSVTPHVDFFALEKSEVAGVASLKEAIGRVRGTCAGRPLLLAGYSQGADVVSRVVNDMTSAESNHVSVGLMGNPSFLPGLARDTGTYNPLLPGIRVALGALSFPITNSVGNRTIDACLGSDLICNSYPSLAIGPLLAGLAGAHLEYVTSKETSVVGNFLWNSRNR